jgi:hypothetical protein
MRPAEAWQPGQAEAVAWWIEDVAHGLKRDPAELDLVDGGPRAADIARWAAGSSFDGNWQPPRMLNARRSRWPSLLMMIRDGEAVPYGDTGLWAPAPGVEPVRRAEVAAIIDAENNDRRFVDGLIVTIGRPDQEVASIYAEAVRKARRTLDGVPATPAAPAVDPAH